jgi:hypothetical protein
VSLSLTVQHFFTHIYFGVQFGRTSAYRPANRQELDSPHYLDFGSVLKVLFWIPTDVPVWSKLESGQLPSMQQLVQILENEMKMNVHMDTLSPHRS